MPTQALYKTVFLPKKFGTGIYPAPNFFNLEFRLDLLHHRLKQAVLISAVQVQLRVLEMR
jgi:hypothetical protein